MNEMMKEKCYSCGKLMEGKIENYKYVECGLNSVTLKNILVFHCKHCGSTVPEISSATELHRTIALAVLTKDSLLTGQEVRFLRKLAGYSATELAEMAGTSKSVISRWENKSPGKESDRLIRLICVHKMMKDCLCNLNNMEGGEELRQKLTESATMLVDNIDAALRKIQNQKGGKKHYMIDMQNAGFFPTNTLVCSPAAPLQ